MWRRRAAGLVLLAAALASPALADQLTTVGASGGDKVSAPAYVGVLDLWPTINLYFGFRAASGTDTANVANVCLEIGGVDSVCNDIGLVNHQADGAALTAMGCVTTAGPTNTCTVKTWYDKSATGATCTQAVAADRWQVWMAPATGIVAAAYAPGNVAVANYVCSPGPAAPSGAAASTMITGLWDSTAYCGGTNRVMIGSGANTAGTQRSLSCSNSAGHYTVRSGSANITATGVSTGGVDAVTTGYDGTNMNFNINGTTNAVAAALNTTSTTLTIGNRATSPATIESFAGVLLELANAPDYDATKAANVVANIGAFW